MREKDLKENGLADMAYKVERDHEVQMARGDLYKIAKYGIKLHEMLKGVSEEQGLEGWVQAKITKAADYLGSVYHHLDYEQKFDEVSESKKVKEEITLDEADFDRDSVTYDEVLPFVKMTYKTLLTDLQTVRKDIETYKAGGDTGEEGGDIDMIMPYLRDLKDMQVKVKTILDNPDMDIETVVDYMMPADLDTSAREELIGRFKKSFAKDPQLAKRLFKDPYESVEEADDKDPDTTFVRWLKSNYDKSPKDLNADEYAKMSKKFQASKKDESYTDYLQSKLNEAKGLCADCGKPSYTTLDEEKQKGVDGKVCWKGYRRMGTKKKGGKTVDNCVKVKKKKKKKK